MAFERELPPDQRVTLGSNIVSLLDSFMERRQSFEAEALPHLDAVYRFAFKLTGSAGEAEDLVQETFLRAYRSWDQYTPGTRAKSWLFTICRNVFLRQRERSMRHRDVVRQAGGETGASTGDEPSNPLFATAYRRDPEGEFFHDLIDDSIIEAIERLPPGFREPVVLSDLEGLPYAEIANVLGVPVGTVKSRLFRGRRLLQRELYEYAVGNGYIKPRDR